jgi:hypothetical protein
MIAGVRHEAEMLRKRKSGATARSLQQSKRKTTPLTANVVRMVAFSFSSSSCRPSYWAASSDARSFAPLGFNAVYGVRGEGYANHVFMIIIHPTCRRAPTVHGVLLPSESFSEPGEVGY